MTHKNVVAQTNPQRDPNRHLDHHWQTGQHLACRIDDLKVPPGNKLHQLTNDREGQHAIAINGQWRICFRFEDGDAYDVEVCDYH